MTPGMRSARLMNCFTLALALASSSGIPAHGDTLFFSENFDATTPTEHNC